jgi:hypothetical protein
LLGKPFEHLLDLPEYRLVARSGETDGGDIYKRKD